MLSSQGVREKRTTACQDVFRGSRPAQLTMSSKAPSELLAPAPPYSIFSHREKLVIACLASISAVFSTISSFIYFPAITAISKSLHITVGMINLTVTSYFVVAGIAPAFIGDVADQSGRRVASILSFTIYLGANVGLALQNSYAVLLVLRCLQSVGASGTVAIAYGVLSDIAPPAERGSYVGILLGFANAAPSLGPVFGGVITERISWRWIFWFLAITSGLHLLLIILLLPETSRKVVGNGSRPPDSLLYRCGYHQLLERRRFQDHGTSQARPSVRPPNPLSCLGALKQRGTFIVIIVGSIQSCVFNSIAGSLSSQLIHVYSLNNLEAGLVYIPSGIGGALAAYFTGILLDRDYSLVARRHPLHTNLSGCSNLPDFPIERARLRSVFYFLAINTIATTAYGWLLAAKIHLAVPLIMLFLTGASSAAIFVACGTLITDLNANKSSTVQASYNLVRCLLNAVGIAAVQPMIDAVGDGWCFTIFAGIGVLCAPLLYLLRRNGLHWRQRKAHTENG